MAINVWAIGLDNFFICFKFKKIKVEGLWKGLVIYLRHHRIRMYINTAGLLLAIDLSSLK